MRALALLDAQDAVAGSARPINVGFVMSIPPLYRRPRPILNSRNAQRVPMAALGARRKPFQQLDLAGVVVVVRRDAVNQVAERHLRAFHGAVQAAVRK